MVIALSIEGIRGAKRPRECARGVAVFAFCASGKLAEEMYEMDPEHPCHRCVGRPAG